MGYRVCQLILPITTYWIGEWQSLQFTVGASRYFNSESVTKKKLACQLVSFDLNLLPTYSVCKYFDNILCTSKNNIIEKTQTKTDF